MKNANKNKFGLFESDMQHLETVLLQFAEVEEAFIFGSRAKGNFRNGSDVDIALKGNALDFSTVSKIAYLLNEETAMPYHFDILDYHRISEQALVEHINRVGICFFRKKSEFLSV